MNCYDPVHVQYKPKCLKSWQFHILVFQGQLNVLFSATRWAFHFETAMKHAKSNIFAKMSPQAHVFMFLGWKMIITVQGNIIHTKVYLRGTERVTDGWLPHFSLILILSL